MKITTKELRTRTRELLDCLDRGEPVTITYRGKPRAKLVSIDREATNDESAMFPVFGMWKDHDDAKNVDAYVRDLRKSRFHAD